MNLWLAPQISEHWPKKSPGRLVKKFTWFNRPGTASALTPKAGTVQACSTSAAEINIRICVRKGIVVRLSTSRRRSILSGESSWGVIYESNSTLRKSEYSYDQYHWWPIVLSVKDGLYVSSNRYSSRIEGSPIKIKIKLGTIVQNNSNGWDSSICWSILVFLQVEIKL